MEEPRLGQTIVMVNEVDPKLAIRKLNKDDKEAGQAAHDAMWQIDHSFKTGLGCDLTRWLKRRDLQPFDPSEAPLTLASWFHIDFGLDQGGSGGPAHCQICFV